MATPSELVEQALQETSGSPPRRLQLRSLGENGIFWAKNLFVFVLFLFLFSLVTYTAFLPFLAAQYGQPAQAEIVGMWVHHGKGTSYNIRVTYYDGSGKETATIDGIHPYIYSGLKIGQQVDIHYFQLFPRVPSLDLSPPNLFGAFLILAVVVLLPIASLVNFLRQRSLLIRGHGVKGRVEETYPKRSKAKFEHEGKEYVLSAAVHAYGHRLNIGDTVVIVHDPDNPNQNMVYDPSNFFWVPIKNVF